jgi:hypothetical protein
MSNGAIDMSCHQRRGNAEVLAAIAAITGQSLIDTDEAFHEARRGHPDKRHATAEAAQAFIDRLKTRLGLAPAVDAGEAAELKHAFEVLIRDESLTITPSGGGVLADAPGRLCPQSLYAQQHLISGIN